MKCTSSTTRHIWSRTQPLDVVDGDLVRLIWCVVCGLKKTKYVGPAKQKTNDHIKAMIQAVYGRGR